MKARLVLMVLLVFITAFTSEAQKSNKKIVVTGFVLDINNKPVPGAMILVDKVNSRIVSDNYGLFTIKVKPGIKTLGAYSFSKGSGEVTFDGKVPVHIVLNGSFSIKDFNPPKPAEKEINVGYGTTKKSELTTEAKEIDATQDRFSSYSSIYDMIKSEVPGVQVIGTRILIRGSSSINADSDPLFIVDGVPVVSISYINPREVKTISVLKGTAASIYGSRAAGGVILIELKGAPKPK